MQSPGAEVVLDPPAFARPMLAQLGTFGAITASSGTRRKGEVVAWSACVAHEDHVLVAAVAADAPERIVVMRVAGAPSAAMEMARSLVRRSGKRLAEGGLCAAHFGDLANVPFGICAPQFVVGPASAWNVPMAGASFAVACTWAEMALDPEQRAAKVRARAGDGRSGDVLTPVEDALEGLTRSLRRAKEPPLRNAALAMQSLLPEHPLLVRERLADLVLTEGLADERADLLGALADELNAALVAALPPSTQRRVVLCRLRLPKSAGGRLVTAYFFDASHEGKSTLDVRLPEGPLPAGGEKAGFALVAAVFDKHRPVVQTALGVEGGLRLRRGFHPDATLEQVRDAFLADGFSPIWLVLDP